MKIQIEPCTVDPKDFIEFLYDNYYPYTWFKDEIELCSFLRVKTDEKTIGYVWFHYLCPEIIEYHMCIVRSYHGRWLGPRTVRHLMAYGHASGARFALATSHSPRLKKLFGRLNIEFNGDIALIDLQKDYNELFQKAKNRTAPSGPSAASASTSV